MMKAQDKISDLAALAGAGGSPPSVSRQGQDKRDSAERASRSTHQASVTAANPPPNARNHVDQFLTRLIAFFTSLRLTVVCLAFGLVLVFIGTLAQVEIGLYKAQNEFFRSFFIFWGPAGASWKIPVFPGGYLLGGVLLLNLIASLFARVSFTRKKAGILLVHVGLILLLTGQLLTDMLSSESGMKLFEGETKNYSEDFRASELVLIDKTDPQFDTVYAIPEHKLMSPGLVRDGRLPLTVRVRKYWPNANLVQPSTNSPAGGIASGATAGQLKNELVVPEPPVTSTDEHNTPGLLVGFESPKGSAGSFLVGYSVAPDTGLLTAAGQDFTLDGRHYEIGMRFRRYYYPFNLTLLKATHEIYRGTDIPKNFASRVRVQNPDRNEARETAIYMNNPLRYGGLTFYQYQMTAGEAAEKAGVAPSSTFQVVRNPSWLTPYLSCVLVALGLVVQFGSHLFDFVKRRTA
jgi:hypothetical protein